MWWPTHARAPLATQNVLFSSAPHASTCRAAATGSPRLSGTYPRERRSTSGRSSTTRTTESSVRVWIGRSWTRKPSAIGARRSRASSSVYAIGSSDTLPLVSTSGAPTSASSRWCSGE